MDCSENKERMGGVRGLIRPLSNDSIGRNVPRVLAARDAGLLSHGARGAVAEVGRTVRRTVGRRIPGYSRAGNDKEQSKYRENESTFTSNRCREGWVLSVLVAAVLAPPMLPMLPSIPPSICHCLRLCQAFMNVFAVRVRVTLSVSSCARHRRPSAGRVN